VEELEMEKQVYFQCFRLARVVAGVGLVAAGAAARPAGFPLGCWLVGVFQEGALGPLFTAALFDCA